MFELESIRQVVSSNMYRVARQGGWSDEIDVEASMLGRIPVIGHRASGFDAGIAAALDLIPRDKQHLISILHAAYTVEGVEQIISESEDMHFNSETCWWLAASNLRVDGGVTAEEFLQQLNDFEILREEPVLRRDVANEMFIKLKNNFRLVDGIPFSIVKQGLQGCYLAGYKYGVQYEDATGTFYIGTYHETLGLEDFTFTEMVDEEGRSMSGPVFGSHQYVRICSFGDLDRALEHLKKYF
ncbi:MAG: hypothetical protein JXR95_14400 [Deltaproteobacteria bacterium]|nr:hypothetical protein [Deltaproteobacteria bacterium]